MGRIGIEGYEENEYRMLETEDGKQDGAETDFEWLGKDAQQLVGFKLEAKMEWPIIFTGSSASRALTREDERHKAAEMKLFEVSERLPTVGQIATMI